MSQRKSGGLSAAAHHLTFIPRSAVARANPPAPSVGAGAPSATVDCVPIVRKRMSTSQRKAVDAASHMQGTNVPTETLLSSTAISAPTSVHNSAFATSTISGTGAWVTSPLSVETSTRIVQKSKTGSRELSDPTPAAQNSSSGSSIAFGDTTGGSADARLKFEFRFPVGGTSAQGRVDPPPPRNAWLDSINNSAPCGSKAENWEPSQRKFFGKPSESSLNCNFCTNPDKLQRCDILASDTVCPVCKAINQLIEDQLRAWNDVVEEDMAVLRKGQQAELEELETRKNIEISALTTQVTIQAEQLRILKALVAAKDDTIAIQNREVEIKDEEIAAKKNGKLQEEATAGHNTGPSGTGGEVQEDAHKVATSLATTCADDTTRYDYNYGGAQGDPSSAHPKADSAAEDASTGYIEARKGVTQELGNRRTRKRRMGKIERKEDSDVDELVDLLTILQNDEAANDNAFLSRIRKGRKG